jgi:hypothetical protein
MVEPFSKEINLLAGAMHSDWTSKSSLPAFRLVSNTILFLFFLNLGVIYVSKAPHLHVSPFWRNVHYHWTPQSIRQKLSRYAWPNCPHPLADKHFPPHSERPDFPVTNFGVVIWLGDGVKVSFQ